MAGEWIKMRSSICTNPRVLRIAELIAESPAAGSRLCTVGGVTLSECVTRDVTRDVTVAALLRLWCVTNDHSRDGALHNTTLETVDLIVGVPGFGAALVEVGWAVFDAQARIVTLPNFLENNRPAKARARSGAAERQAKYRERQKQKAGNEGSEGDVTRDAKRDVTRDVTRAAREEKRRDRKKPPISPAEKPAGETDQASPDEHDRPDGTPAGDGDPTQPDAPEDKPAEPTAFERFWEAYPRRKHRGEAERAWAKLKPDEKLVERILTALQAAKVCDDWTRDGGQYIPYPATWLRAKGWEDDLGIDPDTPTDPDAWRSNPMFADVVA